MEPAKTIGITLSTFDLLHSGHVAMLREAKTVCDYLICGLQVDPSVDRDDKNAPVQTLVERYVQLAGVKYVDEIVCYQDENDVIDILEMFDIKVRILGEEYREKDFTARKNADVKVFVFISTNVNIDLAVVTYVDA